MTDQFHGGCLCGAVRFEVDEFLPQAAHCHCSMCRKFHGAAFATLASVEIINFRWLQGETSLRSYTAENGTVRTFCKNCGSSLMFASPGALGNQIEIALGTIDDDVPVQPSAHIFLKSAPGWLTCTDDLPHYEAGRDSTLIKR